MSIQNLWQEWRKIKVLVCRPWIRYCLLGHFSLPFVHLSVWSLWLNVSENQSTGTQQLCFQYFQGWRSHNLSEPLFQCLIILIIFFPPSYLIGISLVPTDVHYLSSSRNFLNSNDHCVRKFSRQWGSWVFPGRFTIQPWLFTIDLIIAVH